MVGCGDDDPCTGSAAGAGPGGNPSTAAASGDTGDWHAEPDADDNKCSPFGSKDDIGWQTPSPDEEQYHSKDAGARPPPEDEDGPPTYKWSCTCWAPCKKGNDYATVNQAGWGDAKNSAMRNCESHLYEVMSSKMKCENMWLYGEGSVVKYDCGKM